VTHENLTIILPTLNEAGNIRPLITSLLTELHGACVIVVDDNSSDGTPDIVREMTEASSRVALIARKGKACLTTSIMTGVRAATTEYVAWMDADFSHPPKVLKTLYDTALSCGCCIATRYLDPDDAQSKSLQQSIRQNDFFLSSILSAFLNFSVHTVLKLKITDYTSGFIVCRRDLLADHDFVGDYGEYFIELMYFLDRSGILVREVYFQSPPRTWGESKTGTTILMLGRRGLKYIWMMFRLLLPRLFSKKAGPRAK